MKKSQLLIVTVFILTLTQNAFAIKVDGTFNAIKSCAAYKSFKRGHNPGDIHTVPGRTYDIVEENKSDGNWVLVLMPELSDTRRWVSKECGTVNITNREETTGNNNRTSGDSNKCRLKNSYDSYVLALSWQAGFCEHFNYSGTKEECDALNSGDIIITNLTIHGLWPNKTSCGKNYGNCSSDKVDLDDDTVAKISPWMPNWYYSTSFGNYEWVKHGTCQELSDDEYFLLIKRLAEKFNNSALGKFMRDNMGKEVLVSDMKALLISELGAVETNKIELRCTGSQNRYINELWINLPKKLNESGSITELLSGALDKKSFEGNCANKIYVEAPGK